MRNVKIKTKVLIAGEKVDAEINLNDISDEVRRYAEYHLDMIEEDDCEECDCEETNISDFQNTDLINECENRDIISGDFNKINIIDASILKRLLNKFQYLSPEQKRIIDEIAS
mgnify:CR=1 FL=1